MNRLTKPGFYMKPAIFTMAAFFLFNLLACHGTAGGSGGGEEPTVNLDSVKGHLIPLKLAVDYTAHFRNQEDSLEKKCPTSYDSLQFGYAEAFNRDSYQLLLNQKDSNGVKAAGIRIYYGLGSGGQVKLVLVPYDVNGRDILKRLDTTAGSDKQVPGVTPIHADASPADDGGAQALEQGQHCPPICAPSTPLGPQGK